MRNMPTTISSQPHAKHPGGMGLPTISGDEYDARLRAAVGDLSESEQAEVQRMHDHNWTLRAIVDAICERRGEPSPDVI